VGAGTLWPSLMGSTQAFLRLVAVALGNMIMMTFGLNKILFVQKCDN
jgi:hypothetical protein